MGRQELKCREGRRGITERSILIILVLSIFIKLLFIISFHIWSSGDTYGYYKLAKQILNLDLSGYNGQRTPGYPIFIILGFFNHKIIVLYQILLGIILDILVFYLAYDITKSKFKSLIVSLLNVFNLNVVNFEIALMTEFLSLFFTTLLVFMIRKKTGIFLTSICASFLVLIRPNLISVLIFYFIYEIYKKNLRNSFILILFPSLSLIVWSFLNFKYVGIFTISTMTAQNLNHHTLNFPYCSPESNENYKIMKEKSLELFKTYGLNWLKANEFLDFTYKNLSEEKSVNYKNYLKILNEFAIETIKNCPHLYLYSVILATIKFYYTIPLKYENYYGPFHERKFYKFTSFLIEPIWFLSNIITFLFMLLFLIIPILNFKKIDSIWILIFFSSVFQALFVYSDNWRFSIPFMPLVFIYVINKLK